jgi:hypothetical protein
MRCHSSPPLPLACCLVLLALTSVANAEKLVVARSTVSSEYLQKRMVDGKLQPHTYVFMAGRHFPGNTRDRSLERTSFRTIAERLAMDLRQQDFHPAPALSQADLLLIVHWGVTTGNNRDTVAIAASMEAVADLGRDKEGAQKELDEAVAQVDVMGAWQARGKLDELENQTRSEHENMASGQYIGIEDRATLLGLGAELRKEDRSLFGSERYNMLRDMTQEERYFIIVMAYDVPALVNQQQLKRVWTMRTSIRSAGVNFPQALDRIGHIASRYFGVRQNNVALEYTGDRKRNEVVRFGDIVVLGTIDH